MVARGQMQSRFWRRQRESQSEFEPEHMIDPSFRGDPYCKYGLMKGGGRRSELSGGKTRESRLGNLRVQIGEITKPRPVGPQILEPSPPCRPTRPSVQPSILIPLLPYPLLASIHPHPLASSLGLLSVHTLNLPSAAMFTSSPHRPSPPSSLLKTKRKASGTDDSSQASPSRKVRILPSAVLSRRRRASVQKRTRFLEGLI